MMRDEAVRRIAVRMVSCQEYDEFDKRRLTRDGKLEYNRALRFAEWIVGELLDGRALKEGE